MMTIPKNKMNTGNVEADKERLTCYGEDKEDHTGASTSLAQFFS